MGIKGAMTTLKREADFLGMSFSEVLVFIERNPYAASHRAIAALTVYKKEYTL